MRKAILTMSIVAIMAVAVAMPVQAKEATPYTGPYGIDVPKTDIVIGGVRITDEALIAMSGLYLAGMALAGSGFKLKKQI